MAFGRRPHERCLAFPAFDCVDVRAANQERLDRRKASAAGRAHQARFAFRKRGVDVCAGLQQLLDDFRISAGARQRDGRGAVAVDGSDICTGANQTRHLACVVTLDCTVKSGCSRRCLRIGGVLCERRRRHQKKHSRSPGNAAVYISRHSRSLPVAEVTWIHATGTLEVFATAIVRRHKGIGAHFGNPLY